MMKDALNCEEVMKYNCRSKLKQSTMGVLLTVLLFYPSTCNTTYLLYNK